MAQISKNQQKWAMGIQSIWVIEIIFCVCDVHLIQMYHSEVKINKLEHNSQNYERLKFFGVCSLVKLLHKLKMAGCKPVLKIEGAIVPQIYSYAIFQRARHSHPDIFNFFQKGPTLVTILSSTVLYNSVELL